VSDAKQRPLRQARTSRLRRKEVALAASSRPGTLCGLALIGPQLASPQYCGFFNLA
jgi:hypothetical protein